LYVESENVSYKDIVNKYVPTFTPKERKNLYSYHFLSVYLEKEEKQTMVKVLLNPFYK